MRGLALALIAAALVGVSVRWGSFVAGGSDSSCYAIQARRWAAVIADPSRSLQPVDPLAIRAPWPNVAATLAPTGHGPSPTVPGAAVPICPSGLSILMAPLYLLGGTRAMFAIVPFFGVVLVLAVHALGSRFGGRVALASALLTAASPIVLYQVVQPMSDVPAAALWTLALACATGTKRQHPVAAGLAASLAILVRPNLVPLGVVIGLFLLCRPEQPWHRRVRAAVGYALACAPGCLAVAGIQQVFFGSPLQSGYGDATSLFAMANVVPNLQRYLTWLWSSAAPIVALAAASLVLLPGALTWLLAAFVLMNLALYAPYIVFDDWAYLRFLLPSIAALTVLAIAALDALVVRMFGRAGLSPADGGRRAKMGAVVGVLAIVGTAASVVDARTHHAFRLQSLEARFPRSAAFAADRLPSNALLFSSYGSGSLAFYANRTAIVWDQLDPAWFERAIDFARAEGREPVLMLESREEPEFRARFGGQGIAALDWPPFAEVAGLIRFYRPSDRDRFRRGEVVQTEYVR